jgi:hypothetical protein
VLEITTIVRKVQWHSRKQQCDLGKNTTSTSKVLLELVGWRISEHYKALCRSDVAWTIWEPHKCIKLFNTDKQEKVDVE